MYMKRVWGMTAQLRVLYSDKARSFNQWQRALDPNFAIFDHSFRQQIGHLPPPKFIPHNLSWFLLFCYRSPKNRLNYPYRLNFSLYSSFLVCHSPSPINCSLSPFLFSLFSILYLLSLFFFFFFPFSFSLFPFPVPRSPLFTPRSLFSAPCSLFSIPCYPFFIFCSLFPVPCSLFSVLRSLFPALCYLLLVPRSLLLFPFSIP